MKIQYGAFTYNVEQVTGSIYRVWLASKKLHPDQGATFNVEHRNGKLQVRFRSAWKGNRTYSSWQYENNWMPLINTAADAVAKTDGVYDYETGKFYRLIKPKATDDYMWYMVGGANNE